MILRHTKIKWLILVIILVLLGVKLVPMAVQTVNADSHWNLILVNYENRIPFGWKVDLTELSNGQSVDSRIYPSLQQMFNDMRSQGIYPVVASGYRTSKRQKELMAEKVQEFISQGYSKSNAKTEAKKWVAEDGFSEHQTGLAVDINADGIHSSGQQVYAWLADNAWKYGFILRYPDGKTDLTKTDYEPWHYRYVGAEDAAKIHENGLCLEEYIEKTAQH